MFKNEFTCTATGKTYKVRGDLIWKSDNVVYFISCKKYKQQHVGSAFESNFKPRFRVHKNDINTGKDKCGVAKHFINDCTSIYKLENVEVQFIEEVIMAYKVSFGQDINTGKPSYLLLHMIWIVLGIGSAVIDRAIERRKNHNILLLVFKMFYFVSIYLKVQYLCFGLYVYLKLCLTYIVKILLDSPILWLWTYLMKMCILSESIL